MPSKNARPHAVSSLSATFANPRRAPLIWLAWSGFAAAAGGFDLAQIGGLAAWRGSGVQRPDRRVACNIIVGQYYVSSEQTGML